ncbi:NADH-quinone oxidoreductase subunit N [Lacimicrobium alkaliphilum]|uniref:NADH-quinone oxidoreductase subunit N n=1 Tax=Lacimicrobium alkaliphilum TaxID=1526571 RepID=A0ABQ1RAY9_9ALTE|nr:NADH-quinone oxidoreductase subunit N [Lacimicrobium alkaliphilum]GGD60472.1 NADH-quinone oxidoreductase subunit N [Lacimicrobium alkaliphilum]
MSMHELWLLSPIILLGIGILVLMLQTSWKRNANLARGLALMTLLITLVAHLFFYPDHSQTLTLLFEHEPVGGFFSLLLLLASLSVAFLQGPYSGGQSREVSEEFYLLLLLSTLGAMLLVMARHVAGVLISIELMSLAMLAMLAYNRQRRDSLEGAIKYLLLSGAATSLMLLGFGILYAVTGHLLLAEMLAVDPGLPGKAGLILVVAALAFKLSLVPLHFWTPDVYQGAPLNSTLLLTTLSKAAVFALLLKLMLMVPQGLAGDLTLILSWMAIASMLTGNWLALQQNNLKRLMAYSAIAHMGYVLVAAIIAMGQDDDLVLETAAYYMLAYLIASILVFSVLANLSQLDAEKDVDRTDEIRGLFWQHPWLAVTLVLAFLSLAGMPITIGFIGKFYLLTLAVGLSAWWLVGAMLVGSAVGLYYYLRVIFVLFDKTDRSLPTAKSFYLSKIWLGLIAISLLTLGVLPGLLGDQLGGLLFAG